MPAVRLSDLLVLSAAQWGAAVPLLGLPARLQPDVGHPVRLPQAGDPRLPGGGRDLLRRGERQGGARAVARPRRPVQDRLRAGPQNPGSDGVGSQGPAARRRRAACRDRRLLRRRLRPAREPEGRSYRPASGGEPERPAPGRRGDPGTRAVRHQPGRHLARRVRQRGCRRQLHQGQGRSRLDGACRRGFGVERPACPVRHKADQPLGRVRQRRGLHQPGGVLYFARLRRGEMGHHHRISGVYLVRYAREASWKEDHRRDSNGLQLRTVLVLVTRTGPSVDFCGYWQRSRSAA